MNLLSASIAVSVPGTSFLSEDWRFLRLQDNPPGDIPDEHEAELTRGELVDIFASIFDQPSCGKESAVGAYEGPHEGETPEQAAVDYISAKYPGRTGAQQLAAEFGLGDMCLPERIDGGEITKQVYAHASGEDVFEDYDIVSYDADLDGKKRYVESDIYAKIEFSNASYAPIYYFVDQVKLDRYLISPSAYGKVWEWRGLVKDENGDTVENPSWLIRDGRIFFPGNWSGILVFKRLPIKYHLYDLVIEGTVDEDATRHYEARVSAKAPGLSIVHLDISEETRAEETKEKCPWLDFDFGIPPGGYSVTTSCNNCGSDDLPDDDKDDAGPGEFEQWECEDTITAEEWAEQCCVSPATGCMPSCLKVESVFNGPVGAEDDRGNEENVDVVVLMPDEGTPCGTITKTWSTTGGGCCDDVEEISINEDSSDEVIAPNGSATVVWSGGRPPFSISISGEGYSLERYKVVKEVENWPYWSAGAYADDVSCGVLTFTISDGCSEASWKVLNTEGRWIIYETHGQFGFGGHVECFEEDKKYEEAWHEAYDCEEDTGCASAETASPKCDSQSAACEAELIECCCITAWEYSEWGC